VNIPTICEQCGHEFSAAAHSVGWIKVKYRMHRFDGPGKAAFCTFACLTAWAREQVAVS
jgi:hypothetical protein